MQCLACGKDVADKLVTIGGATIMVCTNCGLGQTLDFKPNIGEYHRDETYIKERKQFENIFSKRVEIISKFKTSGNVLEIGSSTGVLLEMLKKKGWNVLGIEPSKASAEFAKEQEIETLNTTFEKAKLKSASYDLVIMNHVLEHMDDPTMILRKIRMALKNEGYLFIDIPNFSSFSSKIFKGRWKYLLTGEHKWHFTEKSLKLLLEKSGFTVERTQTFSGIWGYGNPLLEIFQSLFSFKIRFFTNILTALPTYILTKISMGTGLIIVAKK